jgi:hypothetical protein
MSLIQGNAKSSGAGGFYSTTIDGSLRFNDDDTAYLSRTPASSSNRKTWTWSGWVKRGNLGYKTIFGTGASPIGTTNNNLTQLYFDSNNYLRFLVYSGGTNASFVTSQVFRDTSAWYHIVVLVDTTQATSSNRVKIYINGSQITAFSTSTYPSQNFDGYVNQNVPHVIGVYAGNGGGYHLDGYLAEVNFIDGTALDATSFGEFKSGVWIPKAYSGSYGTNGFYLPLTSDANDDSGNGNDFTANNLASTDYVLDSPTNNFATLNPLRKSSTATLYEGNLKYTHPGGSNAEMTATMGVPSSGKYYWEVFIPSQTYPYQNAGVYSNPETIQSLASYLGSTLNGYGISLNTGNKINNTSQTSYLGSVGTNHLVMIAFDADTGSLYAGKDGQWSNGSGAANQTWAGAVAAFTGISGQVVPGASTSNTSAIYNFGQDSSFAGNKTPQGNTDDNGYGDFYYAPPTGYLALCTANLPDPVASIDPAQDGSPQDHFNTVLWTGDGASSNSITGVGFQPDLVWIKNRSSAYYHVLGDSVRGSAAKLSTNGTWEENNATALPTSYGYVDTFDQDGFGLAGGSLQVNRSGNTYVAWNWKANGSGVSNTDGSITSTVSANTDAGFSIVSYTGSGSSPSTVGHGLPSTPEMIILKNRSVSVDWQVYSSVLGNTKKLILNSTAASASTSNWNSTSPTSSVFTVNGTGSGAPDASGQNLIAYCFHSVDGFSKFGSYTGNGSTDGPFCYTGFRPAFVMIKAASFSQSDTNWDILNTATGTYNVIGPALRANLSSAEVTYSGWDLLSNGFKLRNIGGSLNQSGETYIYMAFAENPFKYSNAR